MARNKFDVDEAIESEFSTGLLKRLISYLQPYKKKLTVTVLLMVASNGAGLAAPYLLADAIDKRIPERDIRGLIMLALAYVCILFLGYYCLKYRMKSMSRLSQDVVYSIRRDIFQHLQRLPFAYYDSRPHGKILVRVVNYVNSLSDLLNSGFINIITDSFSLIIILMLMISINGWLTLIMLIGFPIVFASMILIKNAQRKRWRAFNNKSSNLNAYIHESLNGAKVIQSFAREDFNLGIYRRESANYRNAYMSAVKIQFLLMPIIDNVSTIICGILFIIGVSWVSDGIITVGTLIAFTSYVWRFWGPITNFGNFYNQILNAMAYLERIFETIDEEVNVEDVDGATELPEIKGVVDFDNVSFAYEEGEMVLKAASFHVNAGETVALVGPTGAGKTTIINLLSRFYDVSTGADGVVGRICVDGHNIHDVTLHSLRRQMGVMLQDTFIFSGNIMDNIRYGRLDASDEEVIEAAKVVKAHDFIIEMEKGYQTEVNERGSRLSTGQRQLISFARALLANPKILILDEATSSIDSKTELDLQQGLDKLLVDRTSFVIAHRLSTIKSASRIMYIDHGTIVESGTHDELVALGGNYYKLYRSQYPQ